MVGRRHDSEEIAAKLAHANELAAKGKTQREISKALGVSVMTYHRWKKMVGDGDVALEADNSSRSGSLTDKAASDNPDEIKRLEHENVLLRRLVTDLLLEKL